MPLDLAFEQVLLLAEVIPLGTGFLVQCRPQAQGHGGLKLAQRLGTQPAVGAYHDLDRISLPIAASTR